MRGPGRPDRTDFASQGRLGAALYSLLSVINMSPQAMDANIGMAMSDGRRQRLSAIEQAGPPDQPLS